ncbi:MAG: M24 family metallopeptidase C-terminal domain-containing protein, partial [Alphaproteobacteria bacterium]|nr:M24 family metallopeptidase C-terminal domain-containing protein [Alphaproteobacteria bacterium]
HGVGSYLGVHEGPQRIANPTGGQPGTEEPLQGGMIISNEPGFYKTGAYGIRIENLVLVTEAEHEGYLEFETLTLAPIDRALIDTSLLTRDELHWIDTYHARVRTELGPQMDAAGKAWLDAACAPLDQHAHRT